MIFAYSGPLRPNGGLHRGRCQKRLYTQEKLIRLIIQSRKHNGNDVVNDIEDERANYCFGYTTTFNTRRNGKLNFRKYHESDKNKNVASAFSLALAQRRK